MTKHLLLLILLFTSGLCGISYEILYGRLLANIIGDQFIVSTAILLTFLLGIGLGSLHAHRFWSKLWLIEACIGIYAILFVVNISGIEAFLYTHLSSIGTSTLTSISVAITLLLIPSFAIGVSLPLFAGYIHKLRPRDDYFATSYGIYNLAAAGTVIFIEFWLIRQIGIKQSVFFMSTLNILVVLCLLIFFRKVSNDDVPVPKVDRTGFSNRVIGALVLSSIGSAIFQLLGVRLSEMLLGPYRETFAYVLCIILLGIAIGSLLVRRFKIGFIPLLIANIVALCWTLAGLTLVMQLYSKYFMVFVESYWLLVMLKFSCLALITLGPAITFGATIPALLNTKNKSNQTTAAPERASARSPGFLLYISSLANTAGFLFMSLVLHQLLDYGDILVVIIVLSGLSLYVFGAFKSEQSDISLSKRYSLQPIKIAVGLVLVVLTTRFIWDEELLYQGHFSFHSEHMMQNSKRVYTKTERYKGPQDVISIIQWKGSPYLMINGKISIQLDVHYEKVVGALGGIFATDNSKALVLGVGSGSTAGTVGLLFDQVEAIEINSVILENLSRLEEYNFGLKDMPNVTLIHDDAIHAVKVAEDNYSLILNTVTSPLYFSSSKLYTIDFLHEVQRHLAPGGLYMTWFGSRVGDKGADIMMESLTNVFEHCGLVQIDTNYLIMLCSDKPITAHHPYLIERQTQLAEHFRDEYDIDPANFVYLLINTDASTLRNPDGAALNTLDKPTLAFEMTRVSKNNINSLVKRILENINLEKLGLAFGHFEWGLEAMLAAVHNVAGRTIYNDALILKSKEFKHYYQQADVAVKAGQCEKARESYQKSVGIYGARAHLNLRLGRCYESQSMHSKALEAYNMERDENPNNPQLIMVIIRVLIWLERYEEARLELLKLSVAEEQLGAYHFMYGLTLNKLGDKSGSEKHYAMAKKLDGSLEAASTAAVKITGELVDTQ